MRVIYNGGDRLIAIEVYKAEELVNNTVKLYNQKECLYVYDCNPKEFLEELYTNGMIDITSGYKYRMG